MPLELRQIRHILALAEHGSFARAAVALRLSQPALSRSIQGVEQQVGAALFVRSSAGIVPTDIGRVLVQRGREVVQAAEDLEREILGDRTSQASQIAVGGGPYPVESILSAALARYLSANPRVGVRIQVGNWDELLRRLRTRELEFFVAEISTLEAEHDLEIQSLTEHPLFFVARSGHPLAGRGDITTVDTFAFPFVALSRIPPRILEPVLKAQREASDMAAATRAFPAAECNSLAAVKRIVAGSDAITAVTLSCIEEEIEDRTLTLLGSEPWLSARYGLVGLKGQPLSAAAEDFRDFVIDAESEASLAEDHLRSAWSAASGAPGAARRATTLYQD